jgi:hypothetical protein
MDPANRILYGFKNASPNPAWAPDIEKIPRNQPRNPKLYLLTPDQPNVNIIIAWFQLSRTVLGSWVRVEAQGQGP